MKTNPIAHQSDALIVAVQSCKYFDAREACAYVQKKFCFDSVDVREYKR